MYFLDQELISYRFTHVVVLVVLFTGMKKTKAQLF